MGYGVPVITHDAASHHGPEFAAFVNGQHGASYPEDSIEALGNTISRLLDDPAHCASLGAAGRRVVVDRYNTNVMVDRFLSMVDRNTLIGGAPSPHAPTQTQDEPHG